MARKWGGKWGGKWGADDGVVYTTRLDPADLPPGNSSLTIHAIDNAGNEQISDARRFTVPDTSPRPAFVTPLPLASVWEAFVRNARYEIVGVLDSWKTLSGVKRAWAVGNWDCEIDLDHRNAGNAIALLESKRAGIVIQRDGVTVISGPVTDRGKTLDDQGTKTLTFSGPDDNVHLAGRRAKPEPGTPAPPYSTDAYDDRSGIASTVIVAFVNAHLGPAATDGRRIPLAAIIDPAVGSSVRYQARYEQLLAIIARLARLSSPQLMFDVRQADTDDGLVFTIGIVTDRTDEIVFSETAGTLKTYEYHETFGFGNYDYVLGAGTGTARKIIERANGQSVIDWLRYETASDQRQTADDASLETAAAGDLDNTADARTITLEIEPNRANVWPTDFDAGDLVTVEIDGIDIAETISELAFDVTSKGKETITPTVSNRVGPSLFQPVARAQLDRRLARLEAD